MKLTVNGTVHDIDGAQPWESLLFVLRERLGFYGSKNACEQGECGSCSVEVDGAVVCACLVPVAQAQGRRITTIEGLDDDPVAAAVRSRICAHGGVQCGFCTPGFVVAAAGLLRENPQATEDEVSEGLAGNLCRCTGYRKIVAAVLEAGAEVAAAPSTTPGVAR